jgi:hypothetical protein
MSLVRSSGALGRRGRRVGMKTMKDMHRSYGDRGRIARHRPLLHTVGSRQRRRTGHRAFGEGALRLMLGALLGTMLHRHGGRMMLRGGCRRGRHAQRHQQHGDQEHNPRKHTPSIVRHYRIIHRAMPIIISFSTNDAYVGGTARKAVPKLDRGPVSRPLRSWAFPIFNVESAAETRRIPLKVEQSQGELAGLTSSTDQKKSRSGEGVPNRLSWRAPSKYRFDGNPCSAPGERSALGPD